MRPTTITITLTYEEARDVRALIAATVAGKIGLELDVARARYLTAYGYAYDGEVAVTSIARVHDKIKDVQEKAAIDITESPGVDTNIREMRE